MDKSEFPSDFAVDGRIEDGTRTDDVLGMEFAIGDMGGTAGSAVRNLTREYQICVVCICGICDWTHRWDGWKCCSESHKRIPDLCRLHLDEE